MGMCQNILSALSSLLYIYFRAKPGQTFRQILGLEHEDAEPIQAASTRATSSQVNNSAKSTHAPLSHTRALLWAYFQTSLLITTAAPFGFAALSHISYPTMVLGKSCKLVPVLIMNVLLYRRRFSSHKYLVVAMVTTGISIFMFFGADAASSSKHASKGSNAGGSSIIGLLYLLINLALDGAINSTQDEIFSRYKVTGQQMMFFINIFGGLNSAVLASLPLPYIPILHPSDTRESELAGALLFMDLHPEVVKPLAQFALTGSLGQLFIFETLQHFGSLTLVYVDPFCIPEPELIASCSMITLTRKMFTMILSVIVYNHALSHGQWVGAGAVFAGIGVEAWVKRRGQCKCVHQFIFVLTCRMPSYFHQRYTRKEGHTGKGEGTN